MTSRVRLAARYPSGVFRIYLFAAVLLVIGIIAIVGHFNSEKYKIRKQLAQASRTPVRALGPGQQAKVIGRVVPVEAGVMHAPLTGRACVFYEVIVQERISSGRSTRWVERIRESARVDFALDDTTGLVRVPQREQMRYIAEKDSEQSSGTFNDADPHLEAFLSRHGMRSQGWVFNKSLRYYEGVFEPGETVVVAGVVSLESDPEGSQMPMNYREGPKRALLVAPPGGALLASDERESTSYA